MQKFKLYLLTLISVLYLNTGYALEAKDFDLSGFKPGMSYEQVKEKTDAFTNDDGKKTMIFKSDNKLKNNEPYIRKIITYKNKIEFAFEFVPSTENDDLLLYSIEYKVPNTTENITNLLDATYAKFGDPQYGEKAVNQTQEWCDQPRSTKRCEKDLKLKYIASTNFITLQDGSYLKTYNNKKNKVKIEL
ncbi:hypothetical protein [Lonepinella sp. MS14436]|uniref:hypothetical protein n=1 Tax=Lonepinella sp. MS14436 TaxID=3003619 RepID=UPI0036D8F8DB